MILDENLHYIHMVFPKGEVLPEHCSYSNVSMMVVRGRLSIGLDDQAAHTHSAGTLRKIPFSAKTNTQNPDNAVLEWIVVKAPSPKE